MTDEHDVTEFERSDVPPRLLAWLAALLLGSIAAVLLILSLVFPVALRQQPRGPLRPPPFSPTLQTAPERDLAQYQARERELLGINERAPPGQGRIPIEQAMREVASEGWRNQR